jgi:transcription initiation factor IIE alpha subunit
MDSETGDNYEAWHALLDVMHQALTLMQNPTKDVEVDLQAEGDEDSSEAYEIVQKLLLQTQEEKARIYDEKIWNILKDLTRLLRNIMRKLTEMGFPHYVLSIERLWKAVILLFDSTLITNHSKLKLVKKEHKKEMHK